jgi:hypothetical protein
MPSGGISTGERVPGELYQAVIDRASQGGTINQIAKLTALSWPTVKAIIKRESRSIEQRKQELLDQSLRIARRAANEIERKINDKATLSQLVPVYGCATDKIAVLSPPPELATSQHLHYHLESRDIAGEFNSLLHSLEEKARALKASQPPPALTDQTPDTEQPESPAA